MTVELPTNQAEGDMSRADQDRELMRNVSEREARIADAAQRLAWEKAADWLSQKQTKAEQYPGGDRAIQKGRALAYQNAAQEIYGWVIESDMAAAE